MAVFELAIALLFVGAVLAAWARRLQVPYPALLALAGTALALLPGTPSVTLDPELALALFVAPVLLDAAYDASPRDLKQNWRTVTALALVAVGLTVAVVALVVRAVVPDIPWPAAIALGAMLGSPRRWGLDFVLPAFCATMVISLWRGRIDLRPIVVAGVVVLVAGRFLPGQWHILVGGLAGSLAGAWGHDARA